MRTLLLIGLASLALTGGATDAEARGGRIRFGWPRARTPVSVVSHATAPAPAFAVRASGGVGVRPTYVVLPPSSPRPEPSEARSAAEGNGAPVVKASVEGPAPGPVQVPAPVRPVAGPWCLTRKVVGTGAGFCMIN